jgi:hypothetical protein
MNFQKTILTFALITAFNANAKIIETCRVSGALDGEIDLKEDIIIKCANEDLTFGETQINVNGHQLIVVGYRNLSVDPGSCLNLSGTADALTNQTTFAGNVAIKAISASGCINANRLFKGLGTNVTLKFNTIKNFIFSAADFSTNPNSSLRVSLNNEKIDTLEFLINTVR